MHKDHINGDPRLLYIHCLLHGSNALYCAAHHRSRHSKQAGSPWQLSSRQGHEPGLRGTRKRAKVSHVVIVSMDGLKSALASVAKAGGGNDR